MTLLAPPQGFPSAADSRRRNDTVQRVRMVAGNADFFSLPGGLTLRLEASVTSFVYDVEGTQYSLASDVDLALTDNAHNFVWIDSAGALGRSALPCVYSYSAPGAPATDQHWYDLGQEQMKRFDGAAFVGVSRIFIGYARADAGAVNARYACEPAGLTPRERFQLFGDGADGFGDFSVTTAIFGFNNSSRRYTAVVVRSAALVGIATADLNSGALLRSQGPVVVIGAGSELRNQAGTAGGAGQTGVGSAGAGAPYGGGGGGGGGGTNAGGAGGNSSRHSGAGATGTGGTAGGAGGGAGGVGGASRQATFDHEDWIVSSSGAGGGGGGGDGAAAGGNGGQGGGYLPVWAPVVAVGAGAKIQANGANGAAGPGASRGGGGGGGGGTVHMRYRNLFNDGTIEAVGGTGGASGGAGSGAGGAGGPGIVWSSRI